MFAIDPYLNFNGTCEEAFNLYKSVLGGKILRVERYKDMPSENPLPDSVKEKIMHISLSISKGITLMASDSCEGFGPSLKAGNNFSLCISVNSEEEARRVFGGLSDSGTIIMPLDKTFWGAYYGMFVDKFGIQWMVSYDSNNS